MALTGLLARARRRKCVNGIERFSTRHGLVELADGLRIACSPAAELWRCAARLLCLVTCAWLRY